MQIATFQDMYIAELQELVSVEEQLGEALQHMADAASHAPLRAALELHQKETVRQRERLQSILQKYGANPHLHTDQAMQALINETEKMCKILKTGELRDAGLIASAQKLEHYEIAAYGSAAALAGQLELREDQRLLHDSLEEEKITDQLLTGLAESEINPKAVAA